MVQQTFSSDVAYSAMCLWEAILERINDTGAPWYQFKVNNGTATLRDAVLGLAPACDAAWCELSEDQQDDAGAFDWEFVPTWLANSVDWNGPGYPKAISHP